MIKVHCDIGGEIEQTSGTRLVPSGLTILSKAQPVLPDGWQRIQLPMPDGVYTERQVCPACMRQVWALFGIEAPEPERCVVCGHAPEAHKGPSACYGSTDCRCLLSAAECTDESWAAEGRRLIEEAQG